MHGVDHIRFLRRDRQGDQRGKRGNGNTNVHGRLLSGRGAGTLSGRRARAYLPPRRYSTASGGGLKHHPDANPDVVVDRSGVGPLSLSDLVFESFEREHAIGDTIAGSVGLHGNRYDTIPRDALQRELAGDLVAIATEA